MDFAKLGTFTRQKKGKRDALCRANTTSPIDSWKAMLHESKQFYEQCDQKDASVIKTMCSWMPQLTGLQDHDLTEEIWDIIKRLNGYVGVTCNIPSRMMTRIQSMATQIADDIACGKMSLENLDITKLGSDVLSGCEERDMNKFARNINDLLPALNVFQDQKTTQ